MKHLKIKIIFLSTLVLSLTACLKEARMNIDPETAGNMIEFANTGNNIADSRSQHPGFYSDLGSVKSGASVNFNINVSYSGAGAAPEDITVNLALDNDFLDSYNDINGRDYVLPPATIYSMPTTAIIKKGTRLAQIQVTVTVDASFDFNVNYGLPVKISSASYGTISGNFNKAVYSFGARNSYDGVYTMEATAPMADVVAPTLTGYYPLNVHLVTNTGKSVALYDQEVLGTYGHAIKNGTATSYYGSFSPVFYFDDNGNVTSVSNYYGQLSGGFQRSAVLNPTGVNKLTFNADGSVKTLEVSYMMTQGAAYTPRTYFYEKFTYTGQR